MEEKIISPGKMARVAKMAGALLLFKLEQSIYIQDEGTAKSSASLSCAIVHGRFIYLSLWLTKDSYCGRRLKCETFDWAVKEAISRGYDNLLEDLLPGRAEESTAVELRVTKRTDRRPMQDRFEARRKRYAEQKEEWDATANRILDQFGKPL